MGLLFFEIAHGWSRLQFRVGWPISTVRRNAPSRQEDWYVDKHAVCIGCDRRTPLKSDFNSL